MPTGSGGGARLVGSAARGGTALAARPPRCEQRCAPHAGVGARIPEPRARPPGGCSGPCCPAGARVGPAGARRQPAHRRSGGRRRGHRVEAVLTVARAGARPPARGLAAALTLARRLPRERVQEASTAGLGRRGAVADRAAALGPGCRGRDRRVCGHEARTAGQPFLLAGRAGLHRCHVAGGGPRRRPVRAGLAVGHGPLLPDRGGRAARARHARGLHDAGARRGGHRAASSWAPWSPG